MAVSHERAGVCLVQGCHGEALLLNPGTGEIVEVSADGFDGLQFRGGWAYLKPSDGSSQQPVWAKDVLGVKLFEDPARGVYVKKNDVVKWMRDCLLIGIHKYPTIQYEHSSNTLSVRCLEWPYQGQSCYWDLWPIQDI